MTRRKCLPLLCAFLFLLGGCVKTGHTDFPSEGRPQSTRAPVPAASSGASSSSMAESSREEGASEANSQDSSREDFQESSREDSSQEEASSVGKSSAASIGEPSHSESGGYIAPEMARSDFHESEAQGEAGVLMDLSEAEKGYVAVSAVNEARMKLRVEKGESVYVYDLPWDGTPASFPLQSGSGEYTIQAVANTAGNRYAEVCSRKVQVELEDEFQPFLRPSQYVDYSEDSDCVKAAAELAAGESDALGVVEAVFDYICERVTYDKEKAKTVKKGYLPDPDETLSSGRGICFDYAALAAAMLRSQGIPTKMIFGNVQPKDLYHAWNMFYTEESGWVTVGYLVESNSWSRLDLTFSANGADTEFIGDGTNYTDVFVY